MYFRRKWDFASLYLRFADGASSVLIGGGRAEERKRRKMQHFCIFLLILLRLVFFTSAFSFLFTLVSSFALPFSFIVKIRDVALLRPLGSRAEHVR